MTPSLWSNQKRLTFIMLIVITGLFFVSQSRKAEDNNMISIDSKKLSEILKSAIQKEDRSGSGASRQSSKQTFQMEHCDCQKTINASTWEKDDINYTETTCGRDAFRRGKQQKIVGFSFYGDINTPTQKAKGYFEGIKGNLDLMAKYYPGWVMRVYYDLEVGHPVLQDLCDLACNNEQLDICYAGKLPGTPLVDARKVFAMNWRFFPTLDPQVDALLSRDLDSRLNHREHAAVHEWLHRSNKSFHVMRDHPGHTTTMLGSGWGVRFDLGKQAVRDNWESAWKRAFKTALPWRKRSDWGPDQIFLDKYIWHFARRDSIGHDSYLCKSYGFSLGFPTKRKNEPNNFVAAVVNENVSLWRECPVECRRKKEWTHC